MTSLHVICALAPPLPPIKNPGYAYAWGKASTFANFFLQHVCVCGWLQNFASNVYF